MNFNLRRAKNGLILKITDFVDDEKEEVVFQEKYNEEDDVECFADFLRVLNEYYGPSTGRYSPKRIYIRVAPGDKHEDFKDSLY